MINIGKCNINLLGILIGIIGCFSLIGCGASKTGNSNLSMDVYGFELNYNGKTNLERVPLKTDDLNEIVELYQEAGDDSKYKDSLLIAEKSAQGLGANAFSQDNLDTLERHGLTLSNIEKTQIRLKKYGDTVNAVLLEYEISEGLINEIPLLYVSQLFVPNDENMILMSFITEDQSSYESASNMFKNVK